jgi:hypothetical protein|tara:strand:- start:548 stop:850 length:303 start_codon:yes stop_codon:yes gene_type:complete
MPTYQYYNKKTKEHFTEILPLHKRKFPCKDPFVELSITAPNIAIISDRGGREDKAREQILSASERGYKERDTKEKLGLIKEMPEWSKERREKSKQKRQWL